MPVTRESETGDHGRLTAGSALPASRQVKATGDSKTQITVALPVARGLRAIAQARGWAGPSVLVVVAEGGAIHLIGTLTTNELRATLESGGWLGTLQDNGVIGTLTETELRATLQAMGLTGDVGL